MGKAQPPLAFHQFHFDPTGFRVRFIDSPDFGFTMRPFLFTSNIRVSPLGNTCFQVHTGRSCLEGRFLDMIVDRGFLWKTLAFFGILRGAFKNYDIFLAFLAFLEF
jgi:hypothetical protein